MGKVDIKHAFRICPVQPDQWPLLCFQWLGEYYTDTRLPFGSRSSPFIFNTFCHCTCVDHHSIRLTAVSHPLPG